MTSLSVVILTRNRPTYLAKSLAALMPQLREGDEAVVVNGGDPVQAPAPAKVIDYPTQPYHLSSSRNRGIRETGNPALVFLDDDMAPAPGLLEAYRGRIREGVCLLGGIRFTYDYGATAPPPGIPWYHELEHSVHRWRGGYPDEGGYGGNLCVTRGDVLRVGGFDARFDGCWGWEDTALLVALKTVGVELEECHEAMTYHQYHEQGMIHGEKNRNRAVFEAVTAEYKRGIYPEFPQ